MEGMRDRLESHSAYFSAMMKLVPAQYYKAPGKNEELAADGGHSSRPRKETPKELLRKRKRESRSSVRESEEEVESDKEQVQQFSVESMKSVSLSELQSRLKKKMEEVRVKRKGRQKGEEETRRQENGENHKTQRRQRQKQREKGRTKKGPIQKKSATKVAELGRKELETPVLATPVVTNGGLSFSRFELGDTASTVKKRKDYGSLIKKAENKQKKLEKLKETNKGRAERLEDREKWERVMGMARGKKLKDDPKLLKKTVKRLEKKTQVNRKKWSERVQSERERSDGRQQKRQQNIQERIKKIKAKKARKRAKKKGRL